MHLPARIAYLLIIINIAFLGGFLVLGWSGLTRQQTDFDVITAERINIVNSSGQTVIAISNKERIAAPVMGGKAYPVEVSEGRRYLAGMIFFNEEGDEMGGLVFNSFRQPNGKIAGIGHFSFDRYSDNQVISLEYNENARGVRAGLSFYDRTADGTFKKSLDLIEEARASTTTPQRLEEIKKLYSDISRAGGLGVERVFMGSKDQVPQLLMKDREGRVRARLLVDADDEAKLEFLDETGLVVARFP